jgi:hypothetical protein
MLGDVFYAYLVDNQAIVIAETIDAIRAGDDHRGRPERVDRQDERGTRSRSAAH